MICKTQKDLMVFFNVMLDLEDKVSITTCEQVENLAKNLNQDFIKSRNIDKYINWAIKCMKSGEIIKAKHHALRAKRNSAPFANDYPFSLGADAYVIRYEHGYMDGRMKIKIIKRWQENGIWKYKGMVYKENEIDFEENYQVFIDHTRDLFG